MQREPTEMELRVAEAMYADAHPDADLVPALRDYVGRILWLKSARAAIRAMREPTEKMVYVGMAAHGPLNAPIDMEDGWRAMIDAASPPEMTNG